MELKKFLADTYYDFGLGELEKGEVVLGVKLILLAREYYTYIEDVEGRIRSSRLANKLVKSYDKDSCLELINDTNETEEKLIRSGLNIEDDLEDERFRRILKSRLRELIFRYEGKDDKFLR